MVNMKQLIVNCYKNVFGTAEYYIRTSNRKSELFVFAMHGTPLFHRKRLERLVDELISIYRPISPSDAIRFLNNKEAFQEGPYCLFTFDDGLKNNLLIAEILAEKGVSGLFFIVPDFVESSEPERFYRTNIRPEVLPGLEYGPQDLTCMNRADLMSLQKSGHTIGCHTSDHLLRSNDTSEKLRLRIIESKNRLEDWSGVAVEHFASPIDTLFTVNPEAADLIRESYAVHHLTLPGKNDSIPTSMKALYRRNFEVHWSKGRIRYALGDFDLSRWKKQQNDVYHLLQPRPL